MREIVIVGLGPGSQKYLTCKARWYLKNERHLYFRTLKHPAARRFTRSGNVQSFDFLYKQDDNSGQLNRTISACLLKAARRYGTICYAVPGHPLMGDGSVQRLRKLGPRLGIKIKIVPGISYWEPLLNYLHIDIMSGVKICDAIALDQLKEPCRTHLILSQVKNRFLATRVKLKLLKLYPPNHPVIVVKAAGRQNVCSLKLPLSTLDRYPLYDYNTSIYLPPYQGYLVGDLLEIMDWLRSGNGCPWDKQQTNQSLRQYLIEEAYEVIGAIDAQDDDSLREELGDVLLQVVFHSQIAGEERRFDFSQVVNEIAAKLIRRHPHVFGRGNAEDASEVKTLWEQIKTDERNNRKGKKSNESFIIDYSLPALLKAYKLQKKAADVGFDWPCVQGPLQKAREELAELEEACTAKDQAAVEEELGDYLFTIVNLARFLSVNPELALGKTIGKFVERFRYVLKQAEKAGHPTSHFSLETLDQWWEEAKKFKKMR